MTFLAIWLFGSNYSRTQLTSKKINQAYVKNSSKSATMTHTVTIGNKGKSVSQISEKIRKKEKMLLTCKAWHNFLIFAPGLTFYTFFFFSLSLGNDLLWNISPLERYVHVNVTAGNQTKLHRICHFCPSFPSAH